MTEPRSAPGPVRISDAEYIETRLDDQIHWYDGKSARAQRWYKRLRALEILAAAAIPVIAAIGTFGGEEGTTQLIVGALGALIVVLTAFMGLHQWHDTWIGYRTTCESLKHEKFLYLTRAAPYDVPAPFPLLVQRVESLISRENSMWAQQTRKTAEPRPPEEDAAPGDRKPDDGKAPGGGDQPPAAG